MAGFCEEGLNVNHEQIEALVAVLGESSHLSEIEIRQGSMTLRARRTPVFVDTLVAPYADFPGDETVAQETVEETVGPTEVRAHHVGIFHALGGKPVGNGDVVKAGQVIGHIETMRLMNDCVTDSAGTIDAVLVQDGQPIEFGQSLFRIHAATP